MNDEDKSETPEPNAPAVPASGPVRKPTPLQRDSDYAQRPGFRNPRNAGSKAMKPGKAGGSKKR